MRISDWSSDVCSSDLCAESKFSLDLGGRKAKRPRFHDESTNVTFQFSPDNRNIGDGAIGDPSLRSAQPEAAIDLNGMGYHASRVGAGPRFRQPEATHKLAARKDRKSTRQNSSH